MRAVRWPGIEPGTTTTTRNQSAVSARVIISVAGKKKISATSTPRSSRRHHILAEPEAQVDVKLNPIRMMEKARRKRINNCLDQLRSLLPFTTCLKRDMASLMEQTVEYINTMHTVLNEEKPACLSKIYLVYQKKVEENEFFRKGTSKSLKRKMAASACAYGMLPPQSPQVCQGYCNQGFCNQRCMLEQGMMEPDPKRQCCPYEQGLMQQGMATPTGSGMSNWQPQQHIIEPPLVGMNNNMINQYMACGGSEFRMPPLNSSRYIFGQSPIDAQCGILHRQPDLPSPYSCSTPETKIGSGLPKPVVQCESSPIVNEAMVNDQHTGMAESRCSQDEEKSTSMDDMIAKGRKQTLFDITSLVGNHDHRASTAPNFVHVANQSPWQQQDYSNTSVPFSQFFQKQGVNPPHSLIAPMDMSASPQADLSVAPSPKIMGINKILCRDKQREIPDFSIGKNIGLSLKSSSVSTMLNEVTGPPTTDYSSRSFGSTEPIMGRRMTQMLGNTKWHSQPITLTYVSTAENYSIVQSTPSQSCTTAQITNACTSAVVSCSVKLDAEESIGDTEQKSEALDVDHTRQNSPAMTTAVENSSLLEDIPEKKILDCNNNIDADLAPPVSSEK